MRNSRTINTLRNLYLGFGYRILFLVLNFILRTIFIQILGAELLGIDGLYTNILQVLSLTELGMKNALNFSLYKPLKEDNKEKIALLIAYFRKLYNYIALTIAIIGLALLPFLNVIVNLEEPIAFLELYYIIFLARTVFSYLFYYRVTLVIADQKEYLIRIYSTYTLIVQFILQLIVLLFFENYLLYLIIYAAMQLVSNVYIAHKSSNIYPYLKLYQGELSSTEKTNIVNNIKSLFVYSLGSVLLNKTDTIITSILVGTIWVGLYSNYMMIIEGVKSITQVVFQSIVASIGNLNVNIVDGKKQTEVEKSQNMYMVINFASFWIYGLFSINFFFLFNDFIFIWIGEDFVLSLYTVVPIILNFFMPGMLRSTSIYRDTTGLFSTTKYVYLITSIVNLILSWILGIQFGLTGILYATIISRLLTNFWYEPFILHKRYFDSGVLLYFKNLFKYVSSILLVIGVLYVIFESISITNIYYNFSFKLFLSVVIPNVIFFILFRNSRELKYIKKKILG